MLKHHLHHLSISRPQTLLTSLSVIMFEDTHTHTHMACIGKLAFSFNLYFFGYQISLSVFSGSCVLHVSGHS